MAEQDAVERFEYALEQFQLDHTGPHRVPALIEEAKRLFCNETQALREKVERLEKELDARHEWSTQRGIQLSEAQKEIERLKDLGIKALDNYEAEAAANRKERDQAIAERDYARGILADEVAENCRLADELNLWPAMEEPGVCHSKALADAVRGIRAERDALKAEKEQWKASAGDLVQQRNMLISERDSAQKALGEMERRLLDQTSRGDRLERRVSGMRQQLRQVCDRRARSIQEPCGEVLVPVPRSMPEAARVAERAIAADPDSREYAFNQRGDVCFRIDACIEPALRAVWRAGFKTLGCCCGHGQEAGGIITLDLGTYSAEPRTATQERYMETHLKALTPQPEPEKEDGR